MPTPAQTSLEEIVRAGRDAIEGGGLDAVVMSRIAQAVGVRAPSLYKRVRDRDHLIRLIAESVAAELAAVLDAAATTGDARSDLRAILIAGRAFAHRNPAGYAFVYTRLPDAARPDREHLATSSAALLRAVGALVGDEDALPAARTIVAWMHGFLMMEMNGAFRLGGDVDEAFAWGVDRLTALVAGPGGPEAAASPG